MAGKPLVLLAVSEVSGLFFGSPSSEVMEVLDGEECCRWIVAGLEPTR
jgi:hypothetical protein